MCVTCGCSDDAETTLTNPQTGTIAVLPATLHDEFAHNPNQEHDQHHFDRHSDHAHDPELEQSHEHVLADGTIIKHTHHHYQHQHHAHPHEPGQTHLQAQSAVTESFHDHPQDTTEQAELHARMHHTTVNLEQKILAKNDSIAAQNRAWLQSRQSIALNFVSSPGSGKTTLLTRTIQDLQAQLSLSVIEGDQATTNDADRIRSTGCPVVQINTGTGCHLEAAMVQRGLQELAPVDRSIVLIENVGNLVCPALFDLGEQAKVVILSVTEGEDKPIKYPHMFRASQVMVLTKVDLLPYVPFEVDRCLDYAKQVNPDLQIFQVSATTGAGLAAWYTWLAQTINPLPLKAIADPF